MEFLELAKRRHSVRKFKTQPVEQEKIAQILGAARVAPTAANLQPVRLLVAQDEASLAKVSQAANIYSAPLAIVVCADHARAWKRSTDGKITTDIDASIVTDHMMLEATDIGLGSVWICRFDSSVIKSVFELPNDLEPINILALGYSDMPPADINRHETKRVPIETLLLQP